MKKALITALLMLSITTHNFAHDVFTGAHTHDEDKTTTPQRQNLNHHKADEKASATKGKLTTGQGLFRLSFDEVLTGALPEAALPHEKKSMVVLMKTLTRALFTLVFLGTAFV